MSWQRVADLLGADPYPGEEPQAEANREQLQRDYTTAEPEQAKTFNWVATPLYALVGTDDHPQLLEKLGWQAGMPGAAGTLELKHRWDALWFLTETNMALQAVEKSIKKYTKDQGWNYEGMIGPDGDQLKLSSVPGIGEINPGVKDWRNKEWAGLETFDSPGVPQSEKPFPGLSDPTDGAPGTFPPTYECSECGYPGTDREDWRGHIMREHVHGGEPPTEAQPVVDMDNILPAGWNEMAMDKTVQRQAQWIRLLAETAELTMPDLNYVLDYNPEDQTEPGWQSGVRQSPKFMQDWRLDDPALQNDLYSPPNLTWEQARDWLLDKASIASMLQEVAALIAAVSEGQEFHWTHKGLMSHDAEWWAEWFIEQMPAGYRNSKVAATPQVQIPGPIPFIYDIEQDRIYVGHPGERHADIKGRFTPGGILEGQYDPKGHVQIRTDTDMPYTVKHMAQLWYAMHPELEIKGIVLMVGEDQYKLASANIAHKVRNLMATDPAVWNAYQALSKFGTVYAVGGAVRDVVLGKTPKDIDLMVQGVRPDDVRDVLENLPGRVDYTGKDFGVFRYREDGFEVEVALPRTERSTGSGHKDFDVQSDPFMAVEEDLARRDFTVNAMAVDLANGQLIDPYHGSEDAKAGVLRTVSDQSFEEDPLRILRVLSQISRHGLKPTRDTLEQMKKNAHLLDRLPAERIQDELDKMIKGDNPALAIRLSEDTGIFKYVLPEYEKTIAFDQKNPYHDLLLHDHLKTVLQQTAIRTSDPDVRWAGLLHDIGKPGSAWMNPETGNYHYYRSEDGKGADHWELGAQMAKDALTRLRFPSDRIDRITHIINHHMFPRFENERGARKFINRVGDENADDLLTLRAADIHGRAERKDDPVIMQQQVSRVREAGQPTDLSQLAINGNDLIQAGFQPGPQMGQTLQWLTQQVVDNPSLNNRETLLEMASQVWDETKTSNILDPIQKTLDPAVFNGAGRPEPAMKPKIVEWVTAKVHKVMTDAGWPDPANYLSLCLTGSLTTYQWSESSDFDTSLWIDVERFPEWVRADLIKLMIHECDGTIVPGTTHPLQCFVVDPTTTTKEGIYQPGLRSAYDMEIGEWVVPPEHREIDIHKLYPAAMRYATDVATKMKLMLRYGNTGAVKQYWHFLHRRRMLDMRAGKGDFAESNIVYKLLSNEGLMPLIAEATGEYIA